MSKPTKHFREWFSAKGPHAMSLMTSEVSNMEMYEELQRMCWRAYCRGRQYGFRDGVRRMRRREEGGLK